MIFYSTLLISMLVTVILTTILRALAIKHNWVDIPDERKIHKRPIPRIGGLAMAIGTIIPMLIWSANDQKIKMVIIGAMILVIFGLLDDLINLNYKIKFLSQIFAAMIVILGGNIQITSLGLLTTEGYLLPEWLSIPLTLIVIVGVTNAINLSDGLDGLAGGISLLCFISIGYLSYKIENLTVALCAMAVIGSLVGFLRFNTFPANVFMGDAGSQFLGFLGITLSITITQNDSPFSPLVPLLILGFPVIDTLYVMVTRISEGKSPFYPDKNHFHHKLIRLGLYHPESVIVIYIINSILVIMALVFKYYSEWLILTIFCSLAACVILFFGVTERKDWKIKRYRFIDIVIKGKLRVLKDNKIFIKYCFRAIEYGAPSLLIITSFISTSVPWGYSLGMIVMIILSVGTFFANNIFINNQLLRLLIYLNIPIFTYFANVNIPAWMRGNISVLYNLAFILLLILVLLTIKFSKREGFKGTPTDFLILIIAIVIPNLFDERTMYKNTMLITMQILIYLFSFEVIITESRGKMNKIRLLFIGSMIIFVLKNI